MIRANFLALGHFDVIRNVLAVSQIADGQARVAEQRQQAAQRGRFVQFCEQEGGDAQGGKLSRRAAEAETAGDAAQDQMDLVGTALGEHRLQLLNLQFVARTAAGRIDQDQLQAGQPVDRGPQFARGGDDFHRQVDDVRIRAELFHGGNPVRVDGNQTDATVLAQAVIRSQLGDGGGLPDAGGPDHRDNPGFTRPHHDRTADPNLLFQHAGQARFEDQRVGPIAGACRLADAVDQFAGQVLLNLRIDQVGEQSERRFGKGADRRTRLGS